MKLTEEDKAILKGWGFPDRDLEQIEFACNHSTYKIDGKKVSRSKAIEVLGREQYLSGMGRCAFHSTAYRENDRKVGVMFYFDWKKYI